MLELKIPDAGESIQEVQIGQWLRKEGQWLGGRLTLYSDSEGDLGRHEPRTRLDEAFGLLVFDFHLHCEVVIAPDAAPANVEHGAESVLESGFGDAGEVYGELVLLSRPAKRGEAGS